MAAPGSKLYDTGFYQSQSDLSLQSARKIVPFVMDMLDVSSVCDLGCGVGTWLRAFHERGVKDIYGVDGAYVNVEQLHVPRSAFRPHDLSQTLMLGRSFDLACSLEVAEHLPVSAAHVMVENLCRLAPFVIFSAAVPGQGGTGHINEQWPEFWRSRFATSGFDLVDCFRERFWNDPDVAPWYAQNLFLYVRRDRYPGFVQARPEFARPASFPLDAIHPRLFEQAQNPDFWTILHMVPRIPREALKLMRERHRRLSKPIRTLAPLGAPEK